MNSENNDETTLVNLLGESSINPSKDSNQQKKKERVTKPVKSKLVTVKDELPPIPHPYNHDEYHPTTDLGVEPTENEKHMKTLAVEEQLTSSLFHRCPSDYYSWRLEQRRQFLNAPSVHHLCKSIVMANTKCPHEEFSDRKNSRYYLVIVQFTSRLHNERLGNAIRVLHEVPPSRKLFNFRLVSPEINDKLTGYMHNGVTPLGTREKLPVIISDRIIALDPSFIWLGAGEVDLKWRVSIKDLFKYCNPIVANITYDDVNEDPEP